MSKTANHQPRVEMQEFAINLVALDFRPQMLNLDVLKFSGIIPAEWELTQKPVINNTLVQLQFSNGVNLIAQPRQITLLQAIQLPLEKATLDTPQIVQHYLEKFPHADYQGLSMAPKVLVGFPGEPEAARLFLTQGILNNSGSWQQLGHEPLQASVTLNYQLKRCPLAIAISEVKLNHEGQQMAALLFTGTFNYNIPEQYRDRRSLYLSKRLDKWSTDLVQFSEVVHRKFLATSNAAPTVPLVFPELDPSQ